MSTGAFIREDRDTVNSNYITANRDSIIRRLRGYVIKYNLKLVTEDDLFHGFLEYMKNKQYLIQPDISYEQYIYTFLKRYVQSQAKKEWSNVGNKSLTENSDRESMGINEISLNSLNRHTGAGFDSEDIEEVDCRLALDSLKEEYRQWKELLGAEFFEYMDKKLSSIEQGAEMADKDITEVYGVKNSVISQGKMKLKDPKYALDFKVWVASVKKAKYSLLDFITLCEYTPLNLSEIPDEEFEELLRELEEDC